jgi:uncharacterized protein
LFNFLPTPDLNAIEEKFPQPAGAANDFASVISPDAKTAMEGLSREVLGKTGTAVVVATFKTIGDNEPDMYANKLYEKWASARKARTKVLIFLVLNQRKVRIKTGHGVEGILPDGLVGNILDEQQIIPLLKQGQYGEGLLNAMMAVGQVIVKDAGVTLGEGYHPEEVSPRGLAGGKALEEQQKREGEVLKL